MRKLCLAVIMIGTSLAAQVATTQNDKPKPNELEHSVIKIVVAGVGPAGYASLGTGFFVSDHQVATAAHVYLEAAKTMVETGTGVIGALRVTRDGKRMFFVLDYQTADFAHDVCLFKFNQEEVKKAYPDFDVRPVAIDDAKPNIGDEVNFLGYFASDELPLLSRTIVSGYTTNVPAQPAMPEQIVLDLPANPGQSGSPVFFLRTGKVVGILASFVPITLVPGSLPTHSGLSRSVEVVHLKRLIESAEVR
jgi:S1-C subfamily serine protease